MPTPMTLATTMYHTRKNPLRKVSEDSEVVETARSGKIRKFHKALLRYHAPENYEIVKEGLLRMGRGDLIGSSERHLISSRAPVIPASELIAKTIKKGVAPRLNTFGKNSVQRVAAKAASSSTAPNSNGKSSLAYSSPKAKAKVATTTKASAARTGRK